MQQFGASDINPAIIPAAYVVELRKQRDAWRTVLEKMARSATSSLPQFTLEGFKLALRNPWLADADVKEFGMPELISPARASFTALLLEWTKMIMVEHLSADELLRGASLMEGHNNFNLAGSTVAGVPANRKASHEVILGVAVDFFETMWLANHALINTQSRTETRRVTANARVDSLTPP